MRNWAAICVSLLLSGCVIAPPTNFHDLGEIGSYTFNNNPTRYVRSDILIQSTQGKNYPLTVISRIHDGLDVPAMDVRREYKHTQRIETTQKFIRYEGQGPLDTTVDLDLCYEPGCIPQITVSQHSLWYIKERYHDALRVVSQRLTESDEAEFCALYNRQYKTISSYDRCARYRR